MGITLQNLDVGGARNVPIPQAREIKARVNKWDLIRLKNQLGV